MSRGRLLTLVFLVAVLAIVPAKGLTVKWVQAPTGKAVNFIAPNTPYYAVITFNSSFDGTVNVQVKADYEYWFDQVLADKIVHVHKGLNVIKIPFTLPAKGNEWYLRGVFVKISGIYDVNDPEVRMNALTEVPLSGYYFGGLQMFVNGKQYDPDTYPPVPSGANVLMTGVLYGPGGIPVPHFKIEWIPVIANTPNSYSYTTSSGSFSKLVKAWDWKEYGMCGKKAYFYTIRAIDSNGEVVASWVYTCTCVCAPAQPVKGLVVEKVWTDPANPNPGEDVKIYATIKNTGDSTQTGKVILIINNFQHHDVKTVTLAPGQETTIVWDYVFLDKGVYTLTVQVGSSAKSIEIGVGVPTPSHPISTPMPSAPSLTHPAPGFESILAVAGLLAAMYLLRRRTF